MGEAGGPISQAALFERRDDLEREIERATLAETGRPYLGQIVGSSWEISSRAVGPAIGHVLHALEMLNLTRF